MGSALQSSGRNITYSCSWPAYLGGDETAKPWDAMIAAGCNSWRKYGQCSRERDRGRPTKKKEARESARARARARQGGMASRSLYCTSVLSDLEPSETLFNPPQHCRLEQVVNVPTYPDARALFSDDVTHICICMYVCMY